MARPAVARTRDGKFRENCSIFVKASVVRPSAASTPTSPTSDSERDGISAAYRSAAASVMAFYVLVTEVFIYRDLKLFSDIPRVAVKSMLLVGAIFMVLGTALGFTSYLIDAEIPKKLFDWLHVYVSSKVLFLLLLNAFLLVINMIEIFSAIIIVVPIIVPIAMAYGIDPVHLGIIFLLNLEIGYMLPPLGLNLFLASSRFHKKLPELYRATGPFLLILLAMLALVTYLPSLSLIGAGG